ncbi:MarR family winged helix-turn-helix transcriptional regulator [Corynebacterium oculi]|nr:MarR family transcriptional regulator [Corynebacterium oculi]
MNTNPPDLAESRDLARMIVTVAEQARSSFATAVAPLGLPVHLARTVILLNTPRSMREIATELACDPSHVTGIADQLEQRGLATRIPGADRRVKMLKLTTAGSELQQELSEAVRSQGSFAHQLSPEQRAQLRGLLHALLEPGNPT